MSDMTRDELRVKLIYLLKDYGVDEVTAFDALVVALMNLVDNWGQAEYDRAIDDYWEAIIRNQDGKL